MRLIVSVVSLIGIQVPYYRARTLVAAVVPLYCQTAARSNKLWISCKPLPCQHIDKRKTLISSQLLPCSSLCFFRQRKQKTERHKIRHLFSLPKIWCLLVGWCFT